MFYDIVKLLYKYLKITMSENFSEQFAGKDRRITQEDIKRLESQWDPNRVLKKAREVFPPSVFSEIEAGKWYGIWNNSALGKAGFIEKLNTSVENYTQEKIEILDISSSQEKRLLLEQTWKYEWALSRWNKGFRVKELQMALNISKYGNNTIEENGKWDTKTSNALAKLVRDIWNRERELQDGSIFNQIMFDALYKNIFWNKAPESASSHDYSIKTESKKIFEGKFTRDIILQKPYISWGDVLLLQQMLTRKWYDCRNKDGKLDGVFWPHTSQMLRNFQIQEMWVEGNGKLRLNGATVEALLKWTSINTNSPTAEKEQNIDYERYDVPWKNYSISYPKWKKTEYKDKIQDIESSLDTALDFHKKRIHSREFQRKLELLSEKDPSIHPEEIIQKITERLSQPVEIKIIDELWTRNAHYKNNSRNRIELWFYASGLDWEFETHSTANVLIHELYHAVDDHLGDYEHIIRTWSLLWIPLLKRNEWMTWFSEEYRDEIKKSSRYKASLDERFWIDSEYWDSPREVSARMGEISHILFDAWIDTFSNPLSKEQILKLWNTKNIQKEKVFYHILTRWIFPLFLWSKDFVQKSPKEQKTEYNKQKNTPEFQQALENFVSLYNTMI